MDELRARVRAAVESWVPWFDRATEERSRAVAKVEIARSRAVRERATQTMMRDGYSAYAERLRGGNR